MVLLRRNQARIWLSKNIGSKRRWVFWDRNTELSSICFQDTQWAGLKMAYESRVVMCWIYVTCIRGNQGEHHSITTVSYAMCSPIHECTISHYFAKSRSHDPSSASNYSNPHCPCNCPCHRLCPSPSHS